MKRSSIFFTILLYLLPSIPLFSLEEKHFSIFIASYNNEKYAKENILSALNQFYSNYHIYFVNDFSLDLTEDIVRYYVAKEKKEHMVTIISNKERKGAMRNQYEVVHTHIPDDSIIVILDGDDALSYQNVLSKLNEVYSDPEREIWMTYGQYRGWSSRGRGFNQSYPIEVINSHSYREHTLFPSHLRTYYSWIFKLIDVEDLLFQGEFIPASPDIAVMLPIVEMCSPNHFTFIPEILYLYNESNPLSEHQVCKGWQNAMAKHVRLKKPYRPLLDRPKK